MFVTFICISYFTPQICVSFTGGHSLSHEKKKPTKLVYFLEVTWFVKVRYLKLA